MSFYEEYLKASPFMYCNERGVGKTTELVKSISQDPKGVLVVSTTKMRDWTKHEFGLRDRVYTIDDIVQRQLLSGSPFSNLYIDDICGSNLVRLLNYCFNNNVTIVKCIVFEVKSDYYNPKFYIEGAR